MKVLITFLFLGFCLFGLAPSEDPIPVKIYPNMLNETTYAFTCQNSTQKAKIMCCTLLKKDDNNDLIPKRSWTGNERSQCNGQYGNKDDEYAEMVTSYDTDYKRGACKATLTNNVEIHMSMSLYIR